MKKPILTVIFFVLFLVGCGIESNRFSGESDNWKGEYATNIDGTSENGVYTFGFKNATNATTFKNLEIAINDGEIHEREEEHKGATVKIPTSCSGCAVTPENETIKVTIKWNDKNEETFFLE
nr:hypothetical protein [Neobacillus sp. Marseille-Q6967]